MAYDSISNGSVTAKDFGKKKRTNRFAKLKQCKLDARREQWLSQAKNKGSNECLNCGVGSPPSLTLSSEGNTPLENPEMGSKGEENEGLNPHDSDLESLVSSSRSMDSSRKDRPGSSCGSISGSSTTGCCSVNFSEEEDDGSLDDWEAVADALAAKEEKREQVLEPPSKQERHVGLDAPELSNKGNTVEISQPECRNIIPRSDPNNRAWRPDDTFRPQSLPNLSKPYSFAMNTGKCHVIRRSDAWAHKSTISPRSSCPICYEDLDLTDSSFMPCICGFRLCLFCHKKIFEVGDSRCPGCRRPYDPIDSSAVVNGGVQPVLNGGYRRSFSMSTRPLGKVSH